jgi:hypothetical protein
MSEGNKSHLSERKEGYLFEGKESYLSEREGEEGLMMKGESKRLSVSYWRDPQSDMVRDRGAPVQDTASKLQQ